MTKKPICIYHGNCLDGFGAAFVVNKFFKGDVDFHAGVYGEVPPDVTGRDVYLVDFSYKRNVIEAMAKTANRIVVIDHHKTAEEDLTSISLDGNILNVEVNFDMERSGCVLTYDYFFNHQIPPELLLFIEDRDLWNFEREGTKEICASLFSYPYDFEIWEEFFTPAGIEKLKAEGKTLLRKQEKDVAEIAASSAREMVIGGCCVPVVNCNPQFSSDVGHLLCKSGHIFGATYHDRKDKRVFSLRSIGDFDVSEIAKKYGGGGHKNAAGFSVSHGWEGETSND